MRRLRTDERFALTERSFYPEIMSIIESFGGSSVQEVKINSYPDIVFDLEDRKWILSVKIGESVSSIKDAFLQYLRHKEESKIDFGMLLILPESIRNIDATSEAIKDAIKNRPVTALVDAGIVKEELRDRPFPHIVKFLIDVVLARLKTKQKSYYPLSLVISLLQQQVTEMMKDISLSQEKILEIVTDNELLMDLGHLKDSEANDIARFLASYILMSQILFFRLFYSARPETFKEPVLPVSHHTLRRSFRTILDINYKPIYSVEVLDVIPDDFLKDTFDLIWGLQIENVRYELPGRIFHELMPTKIRKMLAAFYTRPHAAEMLAHLTIEKSNNSVFDPACGSGTILVSAYQRKLELFKKEHRIGNPHKRFCEEEIFGADIMPFAVHLTSANIAAADVATTIDRTQVIQGNSLALYPGKDYKGGIHQMYIPYEPPNANTNDGDIYAVSLNEVDIILMNPPFTKVERGIKQYVDMDYYKKRCGGEVGLWGHFVALADVFLKKGGTFGAVLPINILRGRESENIRKILFNEWTPLYILKPTRNYGFSEWAEYRDILFIAKKEKPKPNHKVKFCLIKNDLSKFTENDPPIIAEKILKYGLLRSPELDINANRLSEIKNRFSNLMWFCGVTDLSHRDILVDFIEKFSDKLGHFPEDYF
ncbi:MAG: N-6 DNA methylase, partial [bacterium]